MLFKLLNLFFHNEEFLKTLGVPRSIYWKGVRDKFIKDHPYCSVCGSKENLVVHHIIPFHVDPSLELNVNNLITLCETKSFNCHLFFGHLKHWTNSNPTVVQDAFYWYNKFVNQR